jgi:hypothetical protein
MELTSAKPHNLKELAERVGFEADFKRQYKDLMRHGQHSKRM